MENLNNTLRGGDNKISIVKIKSSFKANCSCSHCQNGKAKEKTNWSIGEHDEKYL
jgi:hypothetical protein